MNLRNVIVIIISVQRNRLKTVLIIFGNLLQTNIITSDEQETVNLFSDYFSFVYSTDPMDVDVGKLDIPNLVCSVRLSLPLMMISAAYQIYVVFGLLDLMV